MSNLKGPHVAVDMITFLGEWVKPKQVLFDLCRANIQVLFAETPWPALIAEAPERMDAREKGANLWAAPRQVAHVWAKTSCSRCPRRDAGRASGSRDPEHAHAFRRRACGVVSRSRSYRSVACNTCNHAIACCRMRKSRKSHAETNKDLDLLSQVLEFWRARQDSNPRPLVRSASYAFNILNLLR